MSDNHETAGIPAVDNFMAALDSEEKSQIESLHTMVEQFDVGGPIPPASAYDLKQFWDVSRRVNADIPPRPNVAIGLSVFAAYGFEAASAGFQKVMPIQLRHDLMSALYRTRNS
jgi:hypothetical protein